MKKHIPLLVSLCLLYILNLVDAGITISQAGGEDFEEANPVMEVFLNAGIFWFLLIKVVGIAVVCYIIWRGRKYQLAQILTGFVLGIYTALFAWHLFLIYYLKDLC